MRLYRANLRMQGHWNRRMLTKAENGNKRGLLLFLRHRHLSSNNPRPGIVFCFVSSYHSLTVFLQSSR